MKQGQALLGMLLGGALVYSLWNEDENWTAFVYPNSSNLQVYEENAGFETLENCRAAALQRLIELDATNVGDYECGLNCKADGNLPELKICDKTRG